MAEVLSQSQIDALLSAARSGEMNLDSPGENQEKKFRKYDFYSPRKFTKDRLKMLNSIFDNYTRIISSRINALLHTTCDITVDSVEEQRYYEFSNALTESDVLSLAYVTYQGKRDEMSVLLHMSTPVMLSMMDRMMGGDGVVDEAFSMEYSFTDVELRLYENIMQDLVPPIGTSWESYLPLTFDYERVEVNPTLVQLIGLEETVVIVDLILKFPNSEGRLSVCLPGLLLTNLFTEFNRENSGRRISSEDNADEIFDRLRGTDLEIVAELGRTSLQLSDVYHLNVGDVIDLGQKTDALVHLNIGGRKWFDGRMGVFGKNKAVKVVETYHNAERGSV